MHTAVAPARRAQRDREVAQSVIAACVHCGFCNATCPTYQVLGSELEGPRGRIYLMKSLLEQQAALAEPVVSHLDHCLSCLACETTCPSGVRYSHLVDAARHWIESEYPRPLAQRLQRKLLAQVLPYPARMRRALGLAALARPIAALLPRALLPGALRTMLDLAPRRLPAQDGSGRSGVHPAQGTRRARVALLTGCAQQVLGPHINAATVRLLTRLGCEVVIPAGQGCCGALVYHMGDRPGSLPHMRRNIALWSRELAGAGLDAILINTSGCGSVVKDYGHIFRDDPEAAPQAVRVAALTRDITEFLAELGWPAGARAPRPLKVAYHDACSLQHGQKVRRQPRDLLRAAGFELVEVPEGHLCCGSAGTYNILQPHVAAQLGRQKGEAIALVRPEAVAMGNLGCMEQIGRYTPLPVVHTVELLDWAAGGAMPAALA
ncbi:MAG: glycolate oxidase subunit GlcF [Candidatus Lambdaproteobacteria bacterium]|nr:glycolate oxidase subunit GlcF [Candidatus Lambdaproteobacteria bacterium]